MSYFKNLSRKTATYYLLIAAFIFLLIVLFSFRPLGDDNEGLYAQISIYMLKHLNFLTPRLDGLVYVEKPPLLYWLTALSFALLGKHDFVARLPVLSSGLFLLVGSYFFSKRLFSKTFASLIVLILVCQICFAAQASLLMFDMPLTALLSASMFSFYLGYKENNKFYKLFWIFLVLGLLMKGPVAIVLTSLVVLPFIFMKKIKIRDLQIGFGVLTFAIGSIWFLIMSIKIPSFFEYYFINNHILRFLGKMQVNDEITGPIYFYLVRLIACDFPWFILFFLGTYLCFKRKLYKNDFILFMMLWFFTIFVFFSLSKGKANYYLLPAIYPFAFISAYGSLKIPKWVLIFLLTIGTLLVIGAIAIKLHILQLRSDGRLAYKLPLIYLTASIFLAYLVIFLKRDFAIYGIAVSNIVIFIGLFLYVELNQNYFTTKYASLWAKKRIRTNTILIQYGPYWRTSTSVYYIGKNSLLLNDFKDGDLYYGMSLLKNKKEKFINFIDFKHLLKKHPAVIITTKSRIFKKLSHYNIEPSIIKKFGNKIVIVFRQM